MKIETATPGQTSLIELVKTCGEYFVEPLPEIVVTTEDNEKSAKMASLIKLAEMFEEAQSANGGVSEIDEITAKEAFKSDLSFVSDLMRQTGARAVLYTIMLPTALKEKVDELIASTDPTDEDEYFDTTFDKDGAHYFTERERRAGELVLGCLLGKDAQDIARGFAKQTRVDPTITTAHVHSGFAREYLEGTTGLPRDDGQSLTFALRSDIAGALNEIRTQAGESNLRDGDMITLALWNSMFNMEPSTGNSTAISVVPIAVEAKIDPDKSKQVDIRTDGDLYELLKYFASIDFTEVPEQISASITYYLSKNPSAFELGTLAKSPYPKAGDFPLRPLSDDMVASGIYSKEEISRINALSQPLTAQIDCDVYEALTSAGFSDAEISAIVSTCSLSYIDARLSDPDLEAKTEYADIVHDALREMLDHEKDLGQSTKRVYTLINGFRGDRTLPEAIIAAHEQCFGSESPRASDSPVKKDV